MGKSLKGAEANFLASECSGFINETSRSFLKRHSNPESLLGQLKSLYLDGSHQACKDLVQLICEEQHELSGSPDIFVLRAKIALEENADLTDVHMWMKQARLNNKDSESVQEIDQLVGAMQDLQDGLYEQGKKALLELHESRSIGFLASFALGRHLLWKSQELDLSIYYLENAVRTKPLFKNAWESLGFAFNRNGQKGAAQEAFGKCIELETDPEKLSFYRQQLAS